jgi:predicted AlkP superfamily phosphohydrolase/phosphomutase
MTRRRFAVAEHLIRTQPWELFMMVEMGTDRIHHGFWHYADPQHPRFAGHEHPLRWAIRDYYRQIDEAIGRLLTLMPDDVLLVVASDHGARALHGGIAVNEWLVERGYLVLDEYPSRPTPPAQLKINWRSTTCWSEGGYYARVFLNVRGREPQGSIARDDYEPLRDRLIDEMQSLPGPDGEALGTVVVKPDKIFRQCRGIPPDLMCYWGNLSWRSVGSVGHRQRYLYENDTGPDEANHDWEGIFISRDPLTAGRGQVAKQSLLDVGVSLLAAAGLSVPPDTAGQVTLRWT